ncbi:Twitching motility protein PilT [Thioalkalivibrio nitratireducens DSM 14787]|uniref:Twitching motility protein PilT n=1 Tax=Thioalkalivibrio nitratireducens (strain DSM 14787 / UNIQEM 213 / ALEN2) TaxID=1255043 RepID=L0DSN9_THIND|nr:PilT/PilU family type 4a pilus ATPase [Thioalkalivibrio nitratireducens]AGA32012.1 Twitching motility protein PilT [Thioalkalivibrio nitratireducens DSM 14787]
MSAPQIEPYLKLMAQKGASDLFFITGAPISIKVDGRVQPLSQTPLEPGQVEKIAREIMTATQQEQLDTQHSSNFGVSRTGLGRYRINVYRQRGEVAMVIRFIRLVIPTMEELGLPAVLKTFSMHRNGLVLIVGATGTGKSTTLATMIDHRARQETGHILTVEDPIEFLFSHRKSLVGQREVGIDTPSYELALQDGMREAPDVIMVGEARSRETMRAALTYADTGHLVLTTLHATSANQAMDRLINMFPEDFRGQILADLSLNLRAIVAQRLLQTPRGTRVAALEVLVNTPYVSELIREDKIGEIKEAMTKGAKDGMQTFDQALFRLYKAGQVELEEALSKADSRADLEWRLNFGGGVGTLEGEVEEEFRMPEDTQR